LKPEDKLPSGLKLVNGALTTNLRLAYQPMTRQSSKLDLAFNPESLEELQPGAGDYLRLQFRALSAAYLGPGGYWLDFSTAGVLRASIPLMLPKEQSGSRRRFLMFHRNHSDAVQDRIGWVDDAVWGEASGDQSAPGINIDVMLDWKLAPNEARQLMSEPPLVDSVSVSVAFDWEKSHPEMRDYQFWDLLGHEVDGQVVRIIVTEILEYYHIALVWEGADEEADKLKKSQGHEKNIDDHQGGEMNGLQLNETALASLAQLLQLEQVTEEELLTAIGAMAEANAEMQSKLKSNQARAEAFDQVILDKRGHVKQLLVKLEGDCKPGRQKLIDLMQWADLLEFEEELQQALEEKFPATCQKCGSRALSMRSSKEEDVHEQHGRRAEQPLKEGNFKIA